MSLGAAPLRRLLWLFAASVLLCGRVAGAADQALYADFDGDGLGDHATVDSRTPTVLHVWLSRTGTTSLIRSGRSFLGIAAADLNGDRRAELIADDPSAELHVWTVDCRNRLTSYAAHRTFPVTASRPNDRTLDDAPDVGDSALPVSRHLNSTLDATRDAPAGRYERRLGARQCCNVVDRPFAPSGPRSPPALLT